MSISQIPTGLVMDFAEAMALESERPGALRDQYWRDGYLIVNGVLSPDEAAEGARILDDAITLESPESFVHTTWGTRRQLKAPQNSIPALGQYAHHSRMLQLVSALIEGEVRLTGEPIACTTFTGKVCGNLADGTWSGHTDGLPDKPMSEVIGTRAPVWLNFRDLRPGGGAMTLVPGSHHWIQQAVTAPDFVARKKAKNRYRPDEDLPGLDWLPVELCTEAGGVFIYNGHAIHNASDNKHETARQVCLYNFGQPVTDSLPEKRFDPAHLAVMSPTLRRLVGHTPRLGKEDGHGDIVQMLMGRGARE